MATRLRLTDEALEEIGGELEARLFARQGPRDAQLQRTLETVLAGRLLDQAHDRAGVDAVALFERDRAALRSDIEPPHAAGAPSELQLREVQQTVGHWGQRSEASGDLDGAAIAKIGPPS